jgi:hypothetical protein
MRADPPVAERSRGADRVCGGTRHLLMLSLAAVLVPACETVPLMSPEGSRILLQANPSFVVANGGRSVVTAVLSEPAGTFVPDGTVVFFFTSLGLVDGSAQTVNGLARVYFVADSRSGQACVTAYSGGAAPAGCPATSGSGTSDGGSTSGGTTSANGSASIQIGVGSALPKLAIVTADPPRIISPRHATITANVYDEFGNPVQNVPVVFTITDFGTVLEETLDSGGAPRYTDSNGQAFDTLRTRALPAAEQKTITVSASVPNIATDATVSVRVN